MTSMPEKPKVGEDLDTQAVRDVEAAVSRLADRFAQRDPKIAAALRREAVVLRGLLADRQPAAHGLRSSLHRLRELYDSALVAGLYEESKEASLLILLNRLIGV
jgi:hypothetical protein